MIDKFSKLTLVQNIFWAEVEIKFGSSTVFLFGQQDAPISTLCLFSLTRRLSKDGKQDRLTFT